MRSHWLRAALSLAVLLNQVVLPFAHEWRSAVDEARYHRSEIVSTRSGPALSRPAAPHHHHNPDDCDLCLLASRLIANSASPGVAAASRIAAKVQFPDVSPASLQILEAPSPRGPPLA